MNNAGKTRQQQQPPSPWDPFIKSVMTAPAGAAASRVLPDLNWADIMQSHMKTVVQKLLGGSYVQGVLDDGVPTWLGTDMAKAHFHPLHAVAAYGRGLSPSLLSALVSPGAASPSCAAAPAPAPETGDSATASAGAGAATPSSSASPWAAVTAAATAVTQEAAGEARTTNAGFDCNARDSFLRTALHWASTTGQADWISALILAGADPNTLDAKQRPPLQDAIEAAHASAVQSLLEGGADKDVRLSGDIGGNGVGGSTLLVLAAKHGNLEVVKMLCDAGAALEGSDGVGFSALMTAVAHQHLDVTEALLGYGADPETESFRKMTPLMASVAMQDISMTRALLRSGANACHAGIGDLTPLHIASGKGSVALIEDLLRAGADPSARVAYPPPRSTPLHSACRATRLAAVKALLRGGADETMGDLTPEHPPAPASNAPPPGAIAAALAALAAAGMAGVPLSSGGVGGGGSLSPPTRSDEASPVRPSTTPLGVVGFGNFGAGEDPTQRGSTETASEYARRRNPETMEAIRQALRRAPADRAWRRRSWLVMLRASAEADAAAAAVRENWELCSMTGSLVKLIGSGLVLGGGGSGHDAKDAVAKAKELPGVGRDGGVGSGDGEGKEDEATEATKRAKRGGGGDTSAAGGETEEDGLARDTAVSAEDEGLPCAQEGGDDESSHAVAAESGGIDADTGGGGGMVSSRGKDTAEAAGEMGQAEGGLEESNDIDGSRGDDDVGTTALRCLCGRLFDLAAVEEGAFRRVLAYL